MSGTTPPHELVRAPNQNPTLRWGVRVIGLLIAVGGLWLIRELLDAVPEPPPEIGHAATVLPVPKPLPDFTLTDDTGAPFSREAFAGEWSFVFFGYTNCPSICPLTLGALRDLRQELQAGSPSLDAQWVFVSVDPERDSPDTLRKYVEHFDASFRGAMGEPEQLARLTGAIGVFHERAAGGNEEQYDFDHSASVLLVDPQAELHAVFSPPIDPEAAAEAYRAIRRLASR